MLGVIEEAQGLADSCSSALQRAAYLSVVEHVERVLEENDTAMLSPEIRTLVRWATADPYDAAGHSDILDDKYIIDYYPFKRHTLTIFDVLKIKKYAMSLRHVPGARPRPSDLIMRIDLIKDASFLAPRHTHDNALAAAQWLRDLIRSRLELSQLVLSFGLLTNSDRCNAPVPAGACCAYHSLWESLRVTAEAYHVLLHDSGFQIGIDPGEEAIGDYRDVSVICPSDKERYLFPLGPLDDLERNYNYDPSASLFEWAGYESIYIRRGQKGRGIPSHADVHSVLEWIAREDSMLGSAAEYVEKWADGLHEMTHRMYPPADAAQNLRD